MDGGRETLETFKINYGTYYRIALTGVSKHTHAMTFGHRGAV